MGRSRVNRYLNSMHMGTKTIEQYVKDELASLENTYEAVVKEPFYKTLLELRKHAAPEEV